MESYALISVEGVRIDKFISEQIPSLSRSYVQRLIDDGLILVDKKEVKAKYILKENQNIEITLPEPQIGRAHV